MRDLVDYLGDRMLLCDDWWRCGTSPNRKTLDTSPQQQPTKRSRALQIDAYGPADLIVSREVDVPMPQADEVLVELACSGVYFMDVYTRWFMFVAVPLMRS